MKKFIIGGVIVIVLLVGGSYFSRSLSGDKGNPNIIAQKGIHWHPKLEIYVKGELQRNSREYRSRRRASAHTHTQRGCGTRRTPP